MPRKIKEFQPDYADNPLRNFLDQIICGDNLELIKALPDKSVTLVITSPPYFQQRDYGGGMGNEKTIDEYLEILCELFHECVRVVADDGGIVFNLGDKYQDSSLLLVPYRFALKVLEREPVKLTNNITWVKTNPTPRQFKRRLVSSTEPFFHFVKTDEYFYNLSEFMREPDSSKKKGNGATTKLGLKYFELINKSELTLQQKDLARLELMQVIQEVKSGKIEGFRMKIRGLHAEPFGGQEGGRQIQLRKKGFTIIRINGERLKRDVIEGAVESLKGSNHPAIYPTSIIQEFLILLTRPGALVLDPFMGSGSTAEACRRLGRHYIGFDINPNYCAFARARLKKLELQPTLGGIHDAFIGEPD